MHSNLTRFKINLHAPPLYDPPLQIDDPVLPERGDRLAVLRVELDQAIAGRHVDDAVVAPAIGPERHATARELARRHGGALSFKQSVRPDQLTRLAVERDDRPPRAGCC